MHSDGTNLSNHADACYMVRAMIAYLFYFLFAVGFSILLTAAFRRLGGDDARVVSPHENAAFERRMAAIEERFARTPDEISADAPDTDQEASTRSITY
jgi:hypothetical protein